MKKLLSVSLFLFFALSNFFSQAGVDVFHDFYSSATRWHRNNIIEELPQFKPYPIQTIKSILERVIQEGDEENKTLAKNYYKSIFGKPWNISFFADERNIFFQREWTEEKSFKLQSSFLLETFGDAFFGNTFGLSYQAGACLVGFNESARENWGATSRYDTLVKSVEAGPVVFNFNGDVVFSAVKNKMDFLLGYSRVGFAPFLDDDVAFSPTAHDAPYFLFSYNGKRVHFSQYFGALAAENVVDNSFQFGKFFLFQSIRFTLGKRKNFLLTFYDSVIYGKRFDVSYFIPVPSLFIAVANGYDDNVLAGVVLDWNIINGFSWITNFAFDHFDTSRLFRLKFTGDYRFALKTEFLYAPVDALLDIASLSYTLVMPYTYSYDERDFFPHNYRSYTNWGRQIGSVLPPNSDRLSLSIKLNPLKNFQLKSDVNIIRHANVYESVSFSDIQSEAQKRPIHTDGSVQSPFVGTTMFLSETHIMYICNGNIELSYTFPRIKAGQFSLNTKLGFTYIYNAGVDSPIYNMENPLESEKDAWLSSLHNEYRFLLAFGVKYTY